MTTEIFLNVASLEHMTKQPAHRRYALFCMDTRGGSAEFDCYTKSSMGHIDDFTTYKEAKDYGLIIPIVCLSGFTLMRLILNLLMIL